MIEEQGTTTTEDGYHAKTVLIVEDDEQMGTMLLSSVISQTPYEAKWVQDAAHAFAFIQIHKPSVLLLDYHLPDMNGIALYDHLHARKELRALQAVMLTASPLPQKECKKRKLIYIRKPFELDDLLATLHGLLSD